MLPLTSLQITAFLCLLIRKHHLVFLIPKFGKTVWLQRSGYGDCPIQLQDECPEGRK